MKITYHFANNETTEIEVDEEWGNRVIEFDRADYNSERVDHRDDHKYHRGKPMTIEDAESEEYARLKRERGQVRTDGLLEDIIRQEEHHRLHQAVNKLPAEQRDLLNSVFFGDVREVDYARAKGVSKAAISQQLNRALKNLKKILS